MRGDGRTGHRVRAARRIVDLLEPRAGLYIETGEILDIGGERILGDADHQDRLLMRHDLRTGDGSFRGDSGDDIEGTPGVPDRSGDLVCRESVAQQVSIRPTNRCCGWTALRLLDRYGAFGSKEGGGDRQIGAIGCFCREEKGCERAQQTPQRKRSSRGNISHASDQADSWQLRIDQGQIAS